MKENVDKRIYCPKKKEHSDLNADDLSEMEKVRRTGQHARQVYSTLP